MMANVKVFFNPQSGNPEKTNKLERNDTIIFINDMELTNATGITIHRRLMSKTEVNIVTECAPEYSKRKPEDIRGYLTALISIPKNPEDIPTMSLPSNFIGYTVDLYILSEKNKRPVVTFDGYLPMYVELDDAVVRITTK